MTREQMQALVDKIRSTDPETRRKALMALKAVLSMCVSMIDAELNKEVHDNAEKKDNQP